MDDLEDLIEGAEPAVTEADRRALIEAMLRAGMQKEPRASLLVIGAVVGVTVVAPLLVFLFIAWMGPEFPGVAIVAVFVPTLAVPIWLTRRARVRHRIAFAGLMRGRGIRPGACPRCRYTLRGLSGVACQACPECGEAIGVTPPQASGGPARTPG